MDSTVLDGDGGTDDGSPEASPDAATDASDAGSAGNCARAIVGPSGGTVAHSAGAAIVVPVGALAQATPLSLCSVPSQTIAGANAIGSAFEAGPEGQTFLARVEVIVPFDPTRMAPGATLEAVQMRTAPHNGSGFAALESRVDLSAGKVHASTTHFSQFVAAQSTSPIFITTQPALPNGTVGVGYAQQFAAAGGIPPYTWGVSPTSALPPGLSLGATGALSGLPTVANNFAFLIQVQDSASAAVAMAVSMTVNPPNNPVPTLGQVSPSSVPQGSSDTVIVVSGSGFVPTSQVLMGGTALPSTFVAPSQLAASIPASRLLVPGTYALQVSNPQPGGGLSGTAPLTVTPVVLNPVPSVASVTPTQLPVSSVDIQITVSGSNFITSSAAVIGSEALATSYSSSTQLLAIVPAIYLSPGTLRIGVFNPAPGGGYSATTAPISIGSLNPTPTVASISPASVPAGTAALMLSVSGGNFAVGARAFFSGTALATSFVSSSLVTATVPAYLLASPTTAQVLVVNPTPGGGASGAIDFTVTEIGDGGVADAGDAAAPCDPSTTPCPLATNQGQPFSIAVDGANVYWTNLGYPPSRPSNVMMCAVGGCGGNPTPLTSADQNAGGIALDGTSVYWGRSIDTIGNNAVMACALGGCSGAPTLLVSNQAAPFGIAADGTSVFWTNNVYSGGTVMSAGVDGGGVTVLATAPASGTWVNGPGRIAVDATSIYWTGWQTGGGLTKIDKNGMNLQTLWSSTAQDVAVDANFVYWTAYDPTDGGTPGTSGNVFRANKDGTGLTALLSSYSPPPIRIALDATHFYATVTNGGAIIRCPLAGCGGAPTVIASSQNAPYGIAVDTMNVYWTNLANGPNGSVSKMKK